MTKTVSSTPLYLLFAELYDTEPSIRTVLAEALVPIPEVDFDGGAIHIWNSALKVANRHERLAGLVGIACKQFSHEETELQQSLAAYLRTLANAPNPAPSKPSARSPRRPRISQTVWIAIIGATGLVLAGVLPVLFSYLFSPAEKPTPIVTLAPLATNTPTATPLPTATATPRPEILLMDSVDPKLVYLSTSLHNTDDISEILDDILPISSIRSEVINANWRREEAIVGQNPSLIVIHASAFLANRDSPYEIRLDADRKFLGFLNLLAKETDSKVLIYSRGFCGNPVDVYEKDYVLRFPTLTDRLALFPVCKPHTWQNSEIQFDLRQLVKEILDLK